MKLFQTRYFAQKVFKPIFNSQKQQISLPKKVEHYPDSKMIKSQLLQNVKLFCNQLKNESQINTKITLLNKFTEQLRLLKQGQLDQDVLQIFEQNEPLIFEYFNSGKASTSDIDSIIFSLYLDPRFISKNVNSGRLTKLLSSLLPAHFDCDNNQDETDQPKSKVITEMDSGAKLNQLLQILLDSGVPQHKEVARQVCQQKMKNLFLKDTDTLLQDIQSVQSYLTYEFKMLDDRYRYKSDKQQVDSEFILPQVIKSIESRLAENKITREQFIQILRINNEAHKKGLHNFRLIKHFEPLVLEFIEKVFFADRSSHQLLWRIAFSYAINNHEQDMRIVYYKFLHTLFDKIAHDSVLKNQEHTDLSTLKNIVRSIGSTQITSPSILKILKQFNQLLLTDLDTVKSYTTISKPECITSFIDTCVNLRCIDQFDFATEILPLLNFMSKQFVTFKNQLIIAQVLKLLKSLAKGQIYLHHDKMLDIWQQFLKSNISELVQQENFKLNSVGDYAYVAQVLYSDMKIKIEMPDDIQLHLINKLKIPSKTEYNLHNQMKRFLTYQLGENFETEVRVGVLSVDLVLPKYRIAIELDGPSHFIIQENGDLMLTGTTVAKHRVLAQCGQFDRVFQTVGNLAQAEVNNIEDAMEQIKEFIQTKT